MSDGRKTSFGVGALVWAFVGGAVAIAVVGQFVPGYMLDANAMKQANDQTENALKVVAVNVLPDLCATKAQADPDTAALTTIAALSSPRQQADAIVKTQWIVFDGVELSSANKRVLADACAKALFPPVEANAASTG